MEILLSLARIPALSREHISCPAKPGGSHQASANWRSFPELAGAFFEFLTRFRANTSQAGVQSNRSGVQEAKINSFDISAKSRIAFILDNPYESGLKSSPITGGSERRAMPSSPERQNEPQPRQVPPAGDESDPVAAMNHSTSLPVGSGDPRKRSELFSIIESLRSSSPPTNTPRELGFMTPPHLHNLRNTDADAATPQTPTLPPVSADNEYGFLGSSPTPGNRGRTQLGESEIPQSLSTPAAEDSAMENDFLSSPPKLKSISPEPRNNTARLDAPGSENAPMGMSKSARRRSRRSLKKKALNQSKQPQAAEKGITGGMEEPLTKRLRSSMGKTPVIKERPTNEKQADEQSKTDSQYSEHSQGPVDSRSAEEHASKPAPQGSLVRAELPKNNWKSQADGSDCIADSCSDDMETQVASQLEQDLELAVDLDDATPIVERAVDPSEQGPPKKRKRDAEATPSGKERRRSSRLTKTPSVADVEGSHTPRFKRPITSQDIESSPAPKRRKQDAKGDMTDTSKSAEQAPGPDGAKSKVQETQDNSQKRRSSRLSGQAAPAIPEDSPLPTKSPRPSRSRKQGKDKKDSIQEEPPSRERTDSPHETPAENVAAHPVKDEQPEAPVQSEAAQEGSEPLQPTTEIQDQPMDEPGPENQPTASERDIPMTDAFAATEPSPEKKAATREKSPEKKKKKTRGVSRMTQTESEQQPVITEAEIATSLRKVLGDVKLAKLNRDSLKEIDDLLFDIRVETHEALRRNTD